MNCLSCNRVIDLDKKDTYDYWEDEKDENGNQLYWCLGCL